MGPDRRTFLKQGSVLAGAGFLAPALLIDRRGAPDLVLRGAFVIDGTGAAGRVADVAVTGDRISAIGTNLEQGLRELDLRGLVLAPGFIDIHSHADLNLLAEPRAESRIRQGVTTEVVGQDGSSILWTESQARSRDQGFRSQYDVALGFRDLRGFFARLEERQVAVNVASMVGQGTVRGMVVGSADRPATEAEIRRMRGLVRDGLEQGAVGLSSGLEYTPGMFADRTEIAELARELTGTGYPYASHMRNEDDQLLMAVEEALAVGRIAGVPVQVSHLKAQGRRNYWKAELATGMIEAANASGTPAHFDRYPYVAYATGLSNLFPGWSREGGHAAFMQRLRSDQGSEVEAAARDKVALLGGWDAVQITSTGGSTAWARGRKLGELAAERGVEPFALTISLLDQNGGGVGMIGFGMSEENTERLLAHPLSMICSDGGAYAPYGPLSGGSPHPRGYGSFPRLMGHYVRDRRALTLESAVHKVTGMPAAKLQFADRGTIATGMIADLVAFNPDTIADGATFESPHEYPTGIPHVVVAGTPTIQDGEQTGKLAGRPIRGRLAV